MLKQLESTSGSHAIVIGSSMAGLVAARILTQHFEHVTVIERDRYHATPESRPGVPQAKHVHAFMLAGRRILRALFPTLERDLSTAGALNVDMGAEVALFTPAGWLTRFPSDLSVISCSRGLLDWTIRRQFAAFPQVRFLDERVVTGLLPTANGQGVAGVTMQRRGATGREPEQLTASLVVDASGRHSKANQWLSGLGFEAPTESVVDAFLGEATAVFERPANAGTPWKAMMVMADPPVSNRLGVLSQIEGNRWMVSLTGGAQDYPPTDAAGFVEFTRSLRNPIIYDTIKDARLIAPITGFRGMENRLRHYDRLVRLPEGFVALGDAVCAFNPIYGQGMTVACLGASLLDDCLTEQRGNLSTLPRHFHKRLAKLIEGPWMMATGQDYKFPGTVGGQLNPVTRLMHRYVDQVLALCTESEAVCRSFMEVQQMVKPASEMFAPSIMAQVLRRTLRRQNAAPAPQPELASAGH